MIRGKITHTMPTKIRLCIAIAYILVFALIPEIETVSERRLLGKMNKLENIIRNENVKTRKENSSLRRMLEKVEELCNNSASSGTFNFAKFSDAPEQTIEPANIKTEKKHHLEGIQNGEFQTTHKYVHRQNRSNEETKQARRVRRQISQTQNHTNNHGSPTEGFINNLDAIIEMLKSSIKERLSYLDFRLPLSNDLAEIKADVKVIKETEMILTLEINATKHAVEKIEDKLNSTFCEVNATKFDTASICNKSAESNEQEQSHATNIMLRGS